MHTLTLVRTTLLMALIVALNAACAQIPEIERVVDDSVKQAPYPEILPVSELAVQTTPRLTSTSEDDLDARARRLRSRAADLQ